MATRQVERAQERRRAKEARREYPRSYRGVHIDVLRARLNRERRIRQQKPVWPPAPRRW